MLTPSQAFTIASQWGSLIRSGDPGAVFYSFPLNDARPLSEDHRRQCLAYCDSLIAEIQETAADYDSQADESSAELAALRAFFADSPLGDGADKLQRPNEYVLPIDGAVGEFDKLDPFTQGYIEALFFTENDPAHDKAAFLDAMRSDEPYATDDWEGSIPSDAGFADLHPDARARIVADCAAFQAQNAETLDAAIVGEGCSTATYEEQRRQAGRDFWYTRNGHGCGFRDGDWPEPYATQLTAAAKAFGEVSPYLGDDGMVHL